MSSGVSTPLSQASTLINSPTFKETLDAHSSGTALPSSVIVEYLSSKSSAAVFLYDVAREAGFGATLKELQKFDEDRTHAAVFDAQTRSGAGLNLLGRLSESSSHEGSRHSAAITAFTTPMGLAQMAPTLNFFPKPSSPARLILQVATITQADSDLKISPTLSPLIPFFASVPENFTVLLSATPQEIVDFAAISYSISKAHVIHIFDHWSGAREVSQKLTPSLPPAQPVLDTHTAVKKAGYEFFEYFGDSNAANVVVLLNGPLALAIKSVASAIPSFGLVIVKILRPWDETALRKSVPSSVSNVYVLDDVSSSTAFAPLYHDVLGALVHGSQKAPRIDTQVISTDMYEHFLGSAQSLVGFLSSILGVDWFAPPSITRTGKRITFYSSPHSAVKDAPVVASQLFLSNPSIRSQLLQEFDVFSKPGGIIKSTLVLNSPKVSIDLAPLSSKIGTNSELDAVVILEPSLLKTHDLLASLKDGAPVLISTPWSPEEVVSNLSGVNQQSLADKKAQLLIIDVDAVGRGAKEAEVLSAVITCVFLRLYLGTTAKLDTITHLATSYFGPELAGISVKELSQAAWDSLHSVGLPPAAPTEEVSPAKQFSFNAASLPSPETTVGSSTIHMSSWVEAGKHVLFREAFETPTISTSRSQYAMRPSLRPDVVEETFLVTCTVNRRLTPLEYNRNVFHLEFDTSGTGLKYEIGEALGVHGWNDTDEVLEFCTWYGLNPGDVISIPVSGASNKRHCRTVFQAFQQQIDIFGKPPKGFYEALSGYATNREDQMTLRFISSAEGSSTFKKLSELETVTFADVLRKFTSAHPPVEVLCEIIGDIKPRHYSIASAQSAVGDRVDLLVVTVEWATPSGSPRFGQCTRYLSALKPGQKVTVSIKPSVMKLPPDNMQPIVMAGLGTGAAPFRAFMQHRALLASKKIPVGPMLYYFGSRHRSEEYLYGEEIEAYLQDGVITHAGLAFSRDEKKKVYIQHKMLQDGRMLAEMLGTKANQKGVFYLCGPTWPVPDVFEAIVGALGQYDGMERSIAEKYIEDLKEEERYVLEVY